MSTMTAERRTTEVQIRELETTDSLSMMRGRAVPYGVDADIGWFMESFEQGSLAKSIRESAAALPLLMFHDDRSLPIGVAHEYDDQATGLVTTWRLDDSPEAQRAAKLAADGILNFLSIRFAPIRSTWTYVEDFNPELGPAHKDRVVRNEARLVETSMVSTPAYNGASIEWVRSGERSLKRAGTGDATKAWREELDKLRR